MCFIILTGLDVFTILTGLDVFTILTGVRSHWVQSEAKQLDPQEDPFKL